MHGSWEKAAAALSRQVYPLEEAAADGFVGKAPISVREVRIGEHKRRIRKNPVFPSLGKPGERDVRAECSGVGVDASNQGCGPKPGKAVMGG